MLDLVNALRDNLGLSFVVNPPNHGFDVRSNIEFGKATN